MNEPVPDALAAAEAMAARLSDPKTLRDSRRPTGGRAWPQSLAGGAAGIALLHIERARSGRAAWDTAHVWLAEATAGPLSAASNAGLYVGVPAIAFIMHAAAGTTSRYRNTLARLDDAVLGLTLTRLKAAHARIERGERPVMAEFDLIRGLTGLAAHHLNRHPDHPVTRDVLSYLVRLTEPLPGVDGLPPWWTDVGPNGSPSAVHPRGHGNLGVSHGIGAILAVLSLSVFRTRPEPGTDEAIARICAWTDLWAQHDEAGCWWPGFITFDQARKQRVEPSMRPSPSWCYGLAGSARAQQLAGMALGDSARQAMAENAMLATLRAPAQLDRLSEIGLCHGTAGLLQAAARMAADARDGRITAELPRLVTRLAAQIPHAGPDPELLDGAAGVALALHSAGTGTAPASGWDTILALA